MYNFHITFEKDRGLVSGKELLNPIWTWVRRTEYPNTWKVELTTSKRGALQLDEKKKKVTIKRDVFKFYVTCNREDVPTHIHEYMNLLAKYNHPFLETKT